MTPITPSSLLSAGWRLIGNAWYRGREGRLTNSGGGWQIWDNGVGKEIKGMEDLWKIE